MRRPTHSSELSESTETSGKVGAKITRGPFLKHFQAKQTGVEREGEIVRRRVDDKRESVRHVSEYYLHVAGYRGRENTFESTSCV
jgi:hypothetical protein